MTAFAEANLEKRAMNDKIKLAVSRRRLNEESWVIGPLRAAGGCIVEGW
ncbi:hypothetical protein JW998_08945 [candidate division KSB1 bacterium]|nr:hypothetical protein [candidate division KSB1 bacterium]